MRTRLDIVPLKVLVNQNDEGGLLILVQHVADVQEFFARFLGDADVDG